MSAGAKTWFSASRIFKVGLQWIKLPIRKLGTFKFLSLVTFFILTCVILSLTDLNIKVDNYSRIANDDIQNKIDLQNSEVRAISPGTMASKNGSKFAEKINQNKSVIKSVTKVILLAYSRGGSTFLGQLFSQNPESFYWFEIVQPMYLAMSGMMTVPTMELYDLEGNRRNQTELELDFIYENLERFFNCDLDKMPYEMFNQDSVDLSGEEWGTFTKCMSKATTRKTQYFINKCLEVLSPDCRKNAGTAFDGGCFHAKAILDGRNAESMDNIPGDKNITDSMRRYVKCLKESSLEKSVKKCLPSLKPQCDKTQIRAAKILRMRLSDTEILVKRNPDLKIVHQIRDPRGSLLSSQKAGILAKSSDGKFTNEAKLICPKMLEDLMSFRYLKEQYPDNYFQLKYEDNAAAPEKTMEGIYSFLGTQVPNVLRKKMFKMTHGKRNGAGTFATERKNSNATAHSWRNKIKPEDKIIVDRVCRSLLEMANYEI